MFKSFSSSCQLIHFGIPMFESFIAQYRFQSFVNGEFLKEDRGVVKPLLNVVDNQQWKEIVWADSSVVYEGIAAAQRALASWKSKGLFYRADILRQFAGFLKRYKDMLAFLITQEVGKPIQESRGEVDYAIGYFKWFASQAEQEKGALLPSSKENKRLFYTKEAIGVCAFITPWNFPLAMAVRKIAPALAAGCTCVCKPTPEAPLTLLSLGFFAQKIGVDKGVLNIIHGAEDEIGRVLLDSPIIRKLSFTGSTTVGTFLYQASASTLKKLSLELGGNAPYLIFEDADIELAVSQLIACKFRFGGQTCVAPNRVLVQESIYERVEKLILQGVEKLRVGNPSDEDTDISFILHPSVKARVEQHIEHAVNAGARKIYNGGQYDFPVVLTDVDRNMDVFKNEIFGPLLSITTFKTEEEALSLANETNAGLAAYFFTKNLARIFRVSEALHFGIIGCNDGAPSAPELAFGGQLYSGFGREGGPEGLSEYQTEKTISMGIYD
jgi:succinate-semialdehyde dehydrogenase/glutarate-semialdehyde dehydrogenase